MEVSWNQIQSLSPQGRLISDAFGSGGGGGLSFGCGGGRWMAFLSGFQSLRVFLPPLPFAVHSRLPVRACWCGHIKRTESCFWSWKTVNLQINYNWWKSRYWLIQVNHFSVLKYCRFREFKGEDGNNGWKISRGGEGTTKLGFNTEESITQVLHLEVWEMPGV